MAVKLRSEPDYYAQEVTVGGSTFRIRELDDDALEAFMSLRDRARAVMAEALGKPLAETPEAVFAAAASLPAAVQVKLNRMQVEAVDAVLKAGVVGWDLAAPCTPEAVVGLPGPVKRVLVEAIIAVTTLSEPEQAFFGTSPQR